MDVRGLRGRDIGHHLHCHRLKCFLGLASFLCLFGLAQDERVLSFVSRWDVGALSPGLWQPQSLGVTSTIKEQAAVFEDEQQQSREWCMAEYGDRRYLHDEEERRTPPVLFSFPGDLDWSYWSMQGIGCILKFKHRTSYRIQGVGIRGSGC